MVADRGEVAFRIDQHAAAICLRLFHTVGEGGGLLLAAAAGVDDDGAELLEDARDEREAFKMVTGHEGEVGHFRIDKETVAPALVLRGNDEGARRQPVAPAHVLADTRDQAQRKVHGARIALDDGPHRPVSRPGEEGQRGEDVENRERVIGDLEESAAHEGMLRRRRIRQISGRPAQRGRAPGHAATGDRAGGCRSCSGPPASRRRAPWPPSGRGRPSESLHPPSAH